MLLFRREKDGFEKEHVKKWGPDRKMTENFMDAEMERGNGKNKRKKRKAKK